MLVSILTSRRNKKRNKKYYTETTLLGALLRKLNKWSVGGDENTLALSTTRCARSYDCGDSDLAANKAACV